MIDRGISYVIIDSTNFMTTETIQFTVIQEQMVETEFWKQYKRI